jgi:Flp pilus assembly protein TadB
MSAQSDYSRTFGPLFRNMYSDQHLRVSDAERQAVADRLTEHFAEGRLDQAEFDDRVGRAMGAKTRADLSGLFSDLPGAGAPAVPAQPGRRRHHPVLVVVLLVLFVIAAAHAVLWATLPWLWVGFIGVALLFATGALGRHRPHHQDRETL